MKYFLQLTSSDDEEVLVGVDQIADISPLSDGGAQIFYGDDADSPRYVKESMEAIKSMLTEANCHILKPKQEG